MEDLDLMDKPELESSTFLPSPLTSQLSSSNLRTSPVYSALKTLWLLGAIDKSQNLTQIGRQMALFPIEPHLSRSILASSSHKCTKEVLTIISILSASSKLFLPTSSQQQDSSSSSTNPQSKFRHSSGDHLTILNVSRSYDELTSNSTQSSKKDRKEWCKRHFINERTLIEAKKIRQQLVDVCSKISLDPEATCGGGGGGVEEEEAIISSLGHGLVGNSAFLQQDGTYKQTMGHSVSTQTFFSPSPSRFIF